jgi:methylated-DNA-[protein]-cysteine S-methyltransferase
VGHPEGYRQVLATLVNNPIPIVIPCHRVVTNKSGVGSYIGGKETKKKLLDLEKKHKEDAS